MTFSPRRSPGTATVGEPTDSRRHARKKTSYPIEFAIGNGPRHAAICRDISLGGLQVETETTAPFGAELQIFIELSGIAGTTQLRGFVRWTKPGIMGVQLGSFGARVTHAIIALLNER